MEFFNTTQKLLLSILLVLLLPTHLFAGEGLFGPDLKNPSSVTCTLPVGPSITGNNSICSGTSTSFTATATSGISATTTYTWTGPNGFSANTATINGISTAGTYTCTISNGAGCATAANRGLTVNSLPSTPTLSGPTMICGLSSGTYTATVSGAVSYAWTLPAGLSGSSTTGTMNATINASLFSSGSVAVRTISSASCTSATRSLTLTKIPATPSTLSGNPTVTCGFSSGSYTCAASTGATQYNWTLPAGFSGTSTSSTIAPAINNSTFTSGSLSVTASNSCGTSAAKTLAVSKLPATPTSIGGPTLLCGLSTATYTCTAMTGATFYSWTLPSGLSGISSTNSITVTISPGAISGNVSVKANNACGASASKTLAVSSTPATPTTITGPTQICGLTSATYSCTSMSGATSYSWVLPAGLSGSSTSNTITVFINSASFTSGSVSVRAANACGSSVAKTLSLSKIPTAPASVTGPVTEVCAGSTKDYSCPVSTTGATSYNWTAPAGSTISSGQGSTSISVTFPSTFSSGSLSVVASNSCGSSSLRTVSIGSVPAAPGSITGALAAPAEMYDLKDGNNYTYEVAAVTGATNYRWRGTGKLSGLVEMNTKRTINFNIPSNFNFDTLSVRTANACGESPAKTIILDGVLKFVSPEGTDLNYTSCQLTEFKWIGANTLRKDATKGHYINIQVQNVDLALTDPWTTIASQVSPFAGTGLGTWWLLPGIYRMRFEEIIFRQADTVRATSKSTSTATLSASSCVGPMNMDPRKVWISSAQVLRPSVTTPTTFTSLMNNSTGNSYTTSSSTAASGFTDYTSLNSFRANISKQNGNWPSSLELRINATYAAATTANPNPATRSNTRIGVWFDQNNNGYFDANSTEFIGTYNFPSTTTAPCTITINNAVVGGASRFDPLWGAGEQRRLHIRVVGNMAGGFLQGDACWPFFSAPVSGTTTLGETEDYMLVFGSVSSTRMATEGLPANTDASLAGAERQVFPNPVKAGDFIDLRKDDDGLGFSLQSPVLQDMSGKTWPLVPETEGQRLRIPAGCAPGIYLLNAGSIQRPIRIAVW